MQKFDIANMDYSQLNNDEIQEIKEIEQKINQNKTEEIILLAVETK